MGRIVRGLALASSSVLAASAFGADHVVGPGQSIQAAIAIAANGDRVLVQPGVYVQAIDLLGKDIDVLGVGGPAATILDASGSALVLVSMTSGEPATASVSGFTLRGGLTGIKIAGPTHAVIRNVVVEGQTKFGLTSAHAGDGVFATPTDQPFPRLIESIVRGNAGTGVVGALDVERCVVSGNAEAGLVNVNSCVESYVTGNVGTFGGGLVGGKSYSRCVIANNTAIAGAGGSFSGSQTVSISGCEFRGNVAIQRGGGVDLFGQYPDDDAGFPTATIRNCSFFGNSAGQTGGAVYLSVSKSFSGSPNGVTELHRSTFVGNTPNGVAGSCDVTKLRDSVFWAQSNPIVVKRATNPSLDTLLFADFTLSTLPLFGVGNLNADPLLVDPVLGDLHLTAASPCIGTGSPVLVPDVEGDSVEGGVDIGADEFVAHLSVPDVVMAGGPITLRTYGPIGAPVVLFASTSRLDTGIATIAGPFLLGFPLLPAFPLSLGPIGTNSRLELSAVVPPTVPAGTSLHFQVYVGGSASRLTLPVTVIIG